MSSPALPTSVSLSAPPLSELKPALPVMVLARPLPAPSISAVPVSVSFSTLVPSD
jgi:hypothetical protein